MKQNLETFNVEREITVEIEIIIDDGCCNSYCGSTRETRGSLFLQVSPIHPLGRGWDKKERVKLEDDGGLGNKRGGWYELGSIYFSWYYLNNRNIVL